MSGPNQHQQTIDDFGPPERWLPRLLRLLDRQLALCAGLDSMSERQSELVATGDGPAVLEVLVARQPLVDELVSVAGELEPFVRTMGALIPALAAGDRAEVIGRIGRIDEHLSTISARDEADGESLRVQRERAGRELAELSRGRSALSAYGDVPPQGPAFQDRQG